MVCSEWCVMGGVWWVVHDEWCVMSGVWWVVCDEWCVMSGVWWVVCDEWYMMSGVWWVVCDEWCVMSGVWWVVCVEWCVSSGVCRVVCDEWCVMSGAWWVVCDEWCVMSGVCWVVCDEWYVMSGAWWVVCDEWCVMSGVWWVVCVEWCVLSGMWWVVCDGDGDEWCAMRRRRRGRRRRYFLWCLVLAMMLSLTSPLSKQKKKARCFLECRKRWKRSITDIDIFRIVACDTSDTCSVSCSTSFTRRMTHRCYKSFPRWHLSVASIQQETCPKIRRDISLRNVYLRLRAACGLAVSTSGAEALVWSKASYKRKQPHKDRKCLTETHHYSGNSQHWCRSLNIILRQSRKNIMCENIVWSMRGTELRAGWCLGSCVASWLPAAATWQGKKQTQGCSVCRLEFRTVGRVHECAGWAWEIKYIPYFAHQGFVFFLSSMMILSSHASQARAVF